MRPKFLNKNLTSNIKYSIFKEKEFLKLWHYHPEFELVYIVQGNGTLYAGDFIGNFTKDDVFLLGPNVPHMFLSNSSGGSGETYSEAYVFHINELFFNDRFTSLPEFSFLNQVKKWSNRGVMFREKENQELLQILDGLEYRSPSENAIKIIQVFLQLSRYEQHTNLGSLNWLDRFQAGEKRINDVIEYIMLHFKENISLETIAGISGMNKSAFCRYFKVNTGKSFISFLNEIRINYSCKLLMETNPEKSISEACFQSGFNSLSYYNRTFKKLIGTSPSKYQKNKNHHLPLEV